MKTKMRKEMEEPTNSGTPPWSEISSTLNYLTLTLGGNGSLPLWRFSTCFCIIGLFFVYSGTSFSYVLPTRKKIVDYSRKWDQHQQQAAQPLFFFNFHHSLNQIFTAKQTNSPRVDSSFFCRCCTVNFTLLTWVYCTRCLYTVPALPQQSGHPKTIPWMSPK